jgi:hypothetical protein
MSDLTQNEQLDEALLSIIKKIRGDDYGPMWYDSYKEVLDEIKKQILFVGRNTIGAYDELLDNELPDENGQVLGTWATHRNQLREQQTKQLDRNLYGS